MTGAVVHEQLWDEAQAWLIARDAPVGWLLTHELRHEGHPPLWYLILAIPAKLGLPYGSMKVVGVLAGAATAFLLLFAFPRVPLGLRILAPFAFFIAYRYSVVARSYILLFPLLLLIARMYGRRSARPGLFVLLLILLSMVSVHGFAIACALAALFAFELATGRVAAPPKRALVLSAAAFASSSALLILALWPPKDLTSSIHVHSMLSPARHSQVLTSLIPALFWTSLEDDAPLVAVSKVAAALVALTLLVAWIFRSGAGAPFAAGLLAVYIVSLRYFSMWHEGIVFLLILFGAILAFERRLAPRWLTVAGQLVLVLLLVRHAQWTFLSLAYDIHAQSTGSARTAEFLRAQGLDQRLLYGTGGAVVEIQPYFASNIFDNYRLQGRSYWDFSTRNPWPYVAFTPESEAAMTRFLDRVLADRPEVIVYGAGILEDKLYAPRLFGNPSYRHLAMFRGKTFWKDTPMWEVEYHVFQRITPAPPRGTPLGSAPHTGAR
ncbi:MAG: hypothetical protein ABI779_22650 [Acidobacteriota bacterium]